MTVARTGLPEATVQAWFATGIDKWFTAGEALQNKIIDAIIESPVPTARVAPPQNATPTEVYHFYNSILNRQNKDLMTPEQLVAIGLQADATSAQITARLARLNACEVENTTLKAEAKKAKAAAVADIVAKAEAKGLAKHVVAALENTANQDLGTAQIMLDAMDNANTDPAETQTPKRASLHELVKNQKDDGAGMPENRRGWGYEDWAKKDPAGLQAMSPEKREKLVNEM